MRAAEALNVSGDRVFRNMSPEQQANLTDPLYTTEDGLDINFPALGAQLYQGGISLAHYVRLFPGKPYFGLCRRRRAGFGSGCWSCVGESRQFCYGKQSNTCRTLSHGKRSS
jgi:hypothetical protein